MVYGASHHCFEGYLAHYLTHPCMGMYRCDHFRFHLSTWAPSQWTYEVGFQKHPVSPKTTYFTHEKGSLTGPLAPPTRQYGPKNLGGYAPIGNLLVSAGTCCLETGLIMILMITRLYLSVLKIVKIPPFSSNFLKKW